MVCALHMIRKSALASISDQNVQYIRTTKTNSNDLELLTRCDWRAWMRAPLVSFLHSCYLHCTWLLHGAWGTIAE